MTALLALLAGLSVLIAATPLCGLVFRLAETVGQRWRDRALSVRPSALQWGQTLLFLSGAMRAGATLDEALRQLSAQAPPALRQRIARSGWSGALSPQMRVERVMAGEDTAFARAALLLFLDAGGRIGRVLETAAATLQAKGEAEERVRALTAQARASAWVVGLSPFALAALLAVLSPDLMGPMIRSPIGRLLLLGALGMSLAGLWCAGRLGQVDV